MMRVRDTIHAALVDFRNEVDAAVLWSKDLDAVLDRAPGFCEYRASGARRLVVRGIADIGLAAIVDHVHDALEQRWSLDGWVGESDEGWWVHADEFMLCNVDLDEAHGRFVLDDQEGHTLHVDFVWALFHVAPELGPEEVKYTTCGLCDRRLAPGEFCRCYKKGAVD